MPAPSLPIKGRRCLQKRNNVSFILQSRAADRRAGGSTDRRYWTPLFLLRTRIDAKLKTQDTASRQPEQGKEFRRRDGAKTWVCKPCPQAPHKEACQDWDFFFKRDSHLRAVHQMLQSPAWPLPCRILTAVQRAPVRQSFSTPALAPGLSRLNRKGHGRACLFSILHPPSSMDAAKQSLPTASRTRQLRHAIDNPNHGGQVAAVASASPPRTAPPVWFGPGPGAATLLGSRNPGIRSGPHAAHLQPDR